MVQYILIYHTEKTTVYQLYFHDKVVNIAT